MIDLRNLVGQTLDGRFLVRSYLGAGSFGSVVRAEQCAFGLRWREVAVKVFKTEGLSSAAAESIFNEALMVARILENNRDDPRTHHLVSVLDLGTLVDLGGQPYVAMEFVRGGDLLRAAGHGRICSVTRTVRYLNQICAGLSLLHEHDPPIVHRDLKPDNLLVTEKDLVKLGDFGLATMVDQILRDAPAAGAISYQAPESLISDSCTSATDIYSLGLIFLELLTGAQPFAEVDTDLDPTAPNYQYRLVDAHYRARKARYHIDAKLKENLELQQYPRLKEIISTCVETNPIRRYPSASALRKDLEAFESGALATDEKRPPSDREMKKGEWERLVAEGQYYLSHGERTQALAALTQAMQLNPTGPEPYTLVAKVHLEQGNLTEAIRVLQDGLKHGKRRTLLYALAEVYGRRGMEGVARSLRDEGNRCRE